MAVPRANVSGHGAGDGLPLSKSKYCKAEGCMVNLHALNKPYCLKKCLCLQHLKADALQCKGQGSQLWRFCQQCGKLQPLELFQGNKRSCYASLEKRRLLDAAQLGSKNKRAQQQKSQRRPSQAVSDHSTSLDCCAASVKDTSPATLQEDTSYSSAVHTPSDLPEAQPECSLAAAAVNPATMMPTAGNPQASCCTEEPGRTTSGCTAATTAAASDAAALLAEAWWQDQQMKPQETAETGSELDMMLVDVLSKTIANATIGAAADDDSDVQDTDPTEEELEDMIAEELAAAGLSFTPTGMVHLMQRQQQQPSGFDHMLGRQASEAVTATPCCHLSAPLASMHLAQLIAEVPMQFTAAAPAVETSVVKLTARMHALRQQVLEMGQLLSELQALQQLRRMQQQMSFQAAAPVAAVAAPATQLWNGDGSGISEGITYFNC